MIHVIIILFLIVAGLIVDSFILRKQVKNILNRSKVNLDNLECNLSMLNSFINNKLYTFETDRKADIKLYCSYLGSGYKFEKVFIHHYRGGGIILNFSGKKFHRVLLSKFNEKVCEIKKIKLACCSRKET